MVKAQQMQTTPAVTTLVSTLAGVSLFPPAKKAARETVVLGLVMVNTIKVLFIPLEVQQSGNQ